MASAHGDRTSVRANYIKTIRLDEPSRLALANVADRAQCADSKIWREALIEWCERHPQFCSPDELNALRAYHEGILKMRSGHLAVARRRILPLLPVEQEPATETAQDSEQRKAPRPGKPEGLSGAELSVKERHRIHVRDGLYPETALAGNSQLEGGHG